jgi:hypothetical protein
LFGYGSKHNEVEMVSVKSSRRKGCYGYERESSATRDNEKEKRKERRKEKHKITFNSFTGFIVSKFPR